MATVIVYNWNGCLYGLIKVFPVLTTKTFFVSHADYAYGPYQQRSAYSFGSRDVPSYKQLREGHTRTELSIFSIIAA